MFLLLTHFSFFVSIASGINYLSCIMSFMSSFTMMCSMSLIFVMSTSTSSILKYLLIFFVACVVAMKNFTFSNCHTCFKHSLHIILPPSIAHLPSNLSFCMIYRLCKHIHVVNEAYRFHHQYSSIALLEC
jgi:hypothetical protein